MASELNNAMNINPTIVVVDALNYLSLFVSIDEISFKDAFAPARFREMELRVAAVATAAQVANLKLIWVFDNGQATDEALAKWSERRLDEVINAKRPMPCSAETALYAALERAGFVVLFPPLIDGDDAVALLAWRLNGRVLSRDRDLLRYHELPRERVFRGFGIHRTTGKLMLDPQMAPLPNGVERRKLMPLRSKLPADTSDAGLRVAWGLRVPTLCVRALAGVSKRGNADSFTAACGNLNADALGLVSSIYHELGVSDAGVKVTLPAAVYDADGDLEGARLVTTTVVPDACLAKKLVASRPSLAKQWLEATAEWPEPHVDDVTEDERNENWIAHADRAHAVCMIAAEISDSMLYAMESERDAEYSSPQRILRFYENLVSNDTQLNSDSRESPEYVDRDDPMGWCRVLQCAGLNRHGTKMCQAPEGAGHCFPATIAFAQRFNKTPLCAHCVDIITHRQDSSSSRQFPPRPSARLVIAH